MKAADLMTREIVTVGPELPLADAIHLMLDHRISGVPVVDAAAGRLVGLLTTGDLLRRIETGTDTPRQGWLQAFLTRGRMAERYAHTHGRRVQDVMTRDVATVGEASPLDDVVHNMESRHVRRVPVVEGERLVGNVSRSDLVRALGAVLDRARTTVQSAAHPRRNGPAPLDTCAKCRSNRLGGVVELQGEIHDERMRDAMRVIAEAVPGVLAVRDYLVQVEPNPVLYYGV